MGFLSTVSWPNHPTGESLVSLSRHGHGEGEGVVFVMMVTFINLFQIKCGNTLLSCAKK